MTVEGAHYCCRVASALSWAVSVPHSAPEQAVFSPLVPEGLMSTSLLGDEGKAWTTSCSENMKLLVPESISTSCSERLARFLKAECNLREFNQGTYFCVRAAQNRA